MGHPDNAAAIFSTGGVGEASGDQSPWVKGQPMPTTNFVTVPGLISVRCTAAGGANFLAMAVNTDPADPRTDTVAGDVMVAGQRLDDWGLHLIDMPTTMGDLVALSARQHAAWKTNSR